MKVKAVEIARKLGISKATVSLALNNRPGVSESTREKIFECLEEMNVGYRQAETVQRSSIKKVIKIIVVDNKLRIIRDSELDLWTDVFSVFDREIKRMGYTLGLTYVGRDSYEIAQVIQEANEENVAGVILVATEMQPEHFEPFRMIKKPMVIYDNDLSQDYNCVAIDGVTAVRDVVDYLVSRGCREIRYLGNTENIYNFTQRRAGFRAGLRKNRLELKGDSIVQIGRRVEDVYESMRSYLENHRLPDAFIMENYQVSMGVMRALREKKISVPRQVSLVGVDELPSYLTGDCLLTTVKVEHEERANVVMMFLEQEINGVISKKFKAYSNCQLMKGNSVR